MKKCPHCQTENRESAVFCMECGSFLEPNCPNCGARLPQAARFCDVCGHRLGTQAQAPPPSRAESAAPRPAQPASHLHQYIPSELRDKLEAARAQGKMLGERRVVTMLFCDVIGSTASAGQLDPEEWAEVMNGAYQHMIGPIYKYEGTVARLIGDAVLAFFGAPIAHEDDPQRAVLAGLDIVDSLRPYCQQVKERYGLDFDVRVGINTGTVVVGAVGSDLHLEYNALGDAINLAARMEQSAAPGSVQVAEDTYKLVAPLFEFEALGEVQVKGLAEPVRTYRPLRPVESPGRVRGIQGLHAPLVGREVELSALHVVLANLKQGFGRVVCLIGEAGLGKSRLVEEARAEWIQDNPAERWYQVHCLSYENGQPYGLAKNLFRCLGGIPRSDPPQAVRQKLASVLAHFEGDERGRAARLFEALFGLEAENGAPPLEGEAFQRELFALGADLWRRAVAEQPTVLVVDDLHWSDPASVELLLKLFPLTLDVPLALVCAFRPRREAPSWELKVAAETDFPHRYTEISLRPLSENHSDQLVNQLLEVAELPDELRARILERSEGNPFFVEEVVRALIDDEVVVAEEQPGGDGGPPRRTWRARGSAEDFDIPENLQSLLAARLDRLEEEVRQTLQLAAVIGRTFHRRVLRAIRQNGASPDGELDQHLAELLRLEMIRETTRVPEVEYIFRHPLTQEVAYQTILLKRRRQYHQRVGEALEELFPERRDELAPQLARHFAEAGEQRRALEYYTQAGDAAFRLYSHAEALAHYDRALEIAKRLDEAAEDQLLHLYQRRGRTLELASRFAEALASYEELEALAQESGARSLELAALLSQATVRATPNDQFEREKAQALVERALPLARELEDGAAEAKAHWNLLNIYATLGKLQEAAQAGERAIALARQLGLQEQLAFVLNDMPYVYMSLGQMERAKGITQEASELWRHLDNRPMLTDSLGSAATLHGLSGDFEAAVAFSEEAFALSRAIHNPWGQSYSHLFSGYLYWFRGEIDTAVEKMEYCYRYADQAGFFIGQLSGRSQLVMLYAHLGALERAEASLQQIVQHASADLKIAKPFVASIRAAYHLLTGDLDEASRLIGTYELDVPYPEVIMLTHETKILLALARGENERAAERAGEYVSLLKRSSLRLFLPHALRLQGRAQLALGGQEAARDSLEEARREAEALNAHWDLWQILAESEALAENEEKTDALRARAQEHIDFIADHIASDDLRRTFLARPQVKAIIQGARGKTESSSQ